MALKGPFLLPNFYELAGYQFQLWRRTGHRAQHLQVATAALIRKIPGFFDGAHHHMQCQHRPSLARRCTVHEHRYVLIIDIAQHARVQQVIANDLPVDLVMQVLLVTVVAEQPAQSREVLLLQGSIREREFRAKACSRSASI